MTVDEATWRVAAIARSHGATVVEITAAINEARDHAISYPLVRRKTAAYTTASDTDQRTLEALAEERAAEDRTIAVWVEGTPSARVSGRAVAVHVAHLLTGEESKIVEPQASDVEIDRGDTLLLTFEAGLKGINQLRNRLDLRVNESHVVLHSPEVPSWAHRLLDVHVTTHGIDDPVEVTRYEHQPYEDESYEIPMAGLVEGDDV